MHIPLFTRDTIVSTPVLPLHQNLYSYQVYPDHPKDAVPSGFRYNQDLTERGFSSFRYRATTTTTTTTTTRMHSIVEKPVPE